MTTKPAGPAESTSHELSIVEFDSLATAKNWMRDHFPTSKLMFVETSQRRWNVLTIGAEEILCADERAQTLHFVSMEDLDGRRRLN